MMGNMTSLLLHSCLISHRFQYYYYYHQLYQLALLEDIILRPFYGRIGFIATSEQLDL